MKPVLVSYNTVVARNITVLSAEKQIRKNDDIAIVGMACRFPDADNYGQFWENLLNGRNSIREITSDRWDINKYYSSDITEPNKSISKWCGLLEDIDRFDNRFFNISSREAKFMDPQQRILLEETYHCIEDSGIALDTLCKAVTSVFVGAMGTDYQLNLTSAGVETDSYSCLGSYECLLANRLSYIFGFTGQSFTISAACASSLVAVHEAKKILLSGESDYSIAAGVSLNLNPWKYISFSKSRMLSPDGQCKTFDKDANGYVPGDGVGVLLLQPLLKALEQGNRVYGIIKGSAVNHGGQALSITAPRIESQRSVILTAYKDAGITPESVTYVEAHGTGTSLGDPIEVEALNQAFGEYTDKRQFCSIGSVKTNIGHLEAAAGVAGIIKVLLMMQNQKIPDTLNIQNINPILNIEETPFKIAYMTDWRSAISKSELRAGVSSFGFSGVNSHILLESFDNEKSNHDLDDIPEHKHLFVLSAKTEDSLNRIIGEWIHFINGDSFSKLSLKDICATLSNKKQYKYRYGCYVKNKAVLKQELQGYSLPNHQALQTWSLRIGEIIWDGFPKSSFVLSQNGIFLSKLKQIEEKLKGHKDISAAVFSDLYKDNWPESSRTLLSFLVSHAYISTMIEMGFKPELILFERSGLWSALALSNMVRLEDLVLLLISKKEIKQLKLSRPSIPVYDPVSKQILKPYHFSASFIRSLLNQSVSDDTAKKLQKKARLIYDSQFTFKKFIEEWETVFKQSGMSIIQMIHDDNIASKFVLLLTVVIDSCLYRLNRKWALPQQKHTTNKEYNELLEIVAQEIFPKSLFVEALISKPDFDAIAFELNNSSQKMTSVIHPASDLNEIKNIPLWIEEVLQKNGTCSIDINTVDIGEFSVLPINERTISIRIYEKSEQEPHDALLKLWLFGIGINWSLLYLGEKYRKVALPLYPFDQKSFWLHERKKSESENSTQGIQTLKNHDGGISGLKTTLNKSKLQIVVAKPDNGPFATRNIDYFSDNLLNDIIIEIKKDVAEKKLHNEIERGMSEIEGYGVCHLIHSLRNMGIFTNPAEKYTVKKIMSQLKIKSKYKRLLVALLDILIKSDLIQRDGDELFVTDKILEHEHFKLSNDFKARKEELKHLFPDKKAHLDILYTTLSNIEEILKGNVKATDVLFPNSSMAVVEGFYRNNRFADFFNYLTASFIRKHIEYRYDRAQRRKYRILEIGSGTGGTSEAVLKMISPFSENIDFYYTDISPAFVNFGKRQFRAEYPFTKFTTLNIEIITEKKQVELGKFDLIFATNVIHATKDLTSTFNKIKLLLKDDGCLVLSELCSVQPFLTMAFGVLDGWWLFEDKELRLPNSPLLSPSIWKNFYKQMGFQNVGVLGDPDIETDVYNQCVIVGELSALEGRRLDVRTVDISSGASVCNKQLQQDLLKSECKESVAMDSQTSDILEKKIIRILSEILLIDDMEIEKETDLREYGLDSLTLSEFAEMINQTFNTDINPALLYDYTTIKDIALYLNRHYSESAQRGSDAIATFQKNVMADNIRLSDTGVIRSKYNEQDVAIIGISGRFPGAADCQTFWENLINGYDLVTEVPEDRWRWQDYYGDPHKVSNKTKCKWGGFLNNIKIFDADFFNVSRAEAIRMDPQQRLLMEEIWHVIEDAGYNPPFLAGSKTGVFIGVCNEDYTELLLRNNVTLDAYITTGTSISLIPNRISYLLDIHGSSIAIDTACSSSLVALHYAAEAIRNKECSMAFAGGVNLICTPKKYITLDHAGTLSEKGRCSTFDKEADGFIRSEGIITVFMKSLQSAIIDRDHIYGIIKGSAVNHGGLANTLTAPNPKAQSDLLVGAYEKFGIDPSTISYIETHGTGTKVGDPIEINGLKRAFKELYEKNGKKTPSSPSCMISSIKTSIGHMEAAAGIGGVINVLLSMKYKKIPGTIHFKELNPYISLDDSPFFISKENFKWNNLNDEAGRNIARRAGVSAFGVGGTNAHVIIEEPPSLNIIESFNDNNLIVLSAKTETALEVLSNNLARHLRKFPDKKLEDISFTLQTGRKEMQFRRFFICSSAAEAIKLLESPTLKEVKTGKIHKKAMPVVFMFPGQGAQYINMGQELYRAEPVFKKYVDECSEILIRVLNVDIRKIIFAETENMHQVENDLKQTAMTQPALFVIEYSLAMLWNYWGIKPSAMIGHSLGEYVAACIANVLSLADALSVVSYRARLMQEIPAGSMLAVRLSEKDITPYLSNGISLAACNAPAISVVSGENHKIDMFIKKMDAINARSFKLHTSHAFHSDMMLPILESYTKKLSEIHLSPPDMPFISCLTGKWITDEQATSPAYWANQTCNPVRFSDGINELKKNAGQIYLEVGPGSTLSNLAIQHNLENVITSFSHVKNKVSEIVSMNRALGHLWLNGIKVDWAKYNNQKNRSRVSLPGYPFEGKMYWIDEIVPTSDQKIADIREQKPIESGNKTFLTKVCRILEKLSGTTISDTSASFIELGFDSILLAYVVTQFRKEFNVELSISQFFEEVPTPRLLADYINSAIGGRPIKNDLSTDVMKVSKDNSEMQIQTVIDGTDAFQMIMSQIQRMGGQIENLNNQMKSLFSKEIEGNRININSNPAEVSDTKADRKVEGGQPIKQDQTDDITWEEGEI